MVYADFAGMKIKYFKRIGLLFGPYSDSFEGRHKYSRQMDAVHYITHDDQIVSRTITHSNIASFLGIPLCALEEA